MNLKEYLFLFDIDGTIIDIKGDGKKALIQAIEESLNVKINEKISLLGGIDNIFFKYYYEFYKFSPDKFDFYWNLFKEKYVDMMNSFNKENWHIFPNSFESISFLSKYSNIGLATGNIVAGAMIKLKRFNIDTFFLSGGFGDKAKNRSDIVKDAIESSEFIYQKKFANKNIFLFGDTEKDIKSAIDNKIIPVLIDPNIINKEKASAWNARYYGNFIYFDNLLNLIFKRNLYDKTIFFDNPFK